MSEAVSEKRRGVKAQMKKFGFVSCKAYKKWLCRYRRTMRDAITDHPHDGWQVRGTA